MAVYTVAVAKHAKLTEDVVDTVNITGVFATVRVTNRNRNTDRVNTIYVRTDGIDPVFEGDDSYVVLPFMEKLVTVADITAIQVRLISERSSDYSVEGV